MPLKLRPTGLMLRDRQGPAGLHHLTAAVGLSAASTRRAAVPTACAGSGRLTVNGTDDALGSRSDAWRRPRPGFRRAGTPGRHWRSRKRYRKSRLRKYRRGWRRLLAEHFVARLLCRLATIVFQHEQPERRREITVLALLIDATDNSDIVTWRSPAIFFSAFQNSSSRLTLVLRPARKIERLTTSDFMMVPASYVGTMVPKCGAIWQADTKQ